MSSRKKTQVASKAPPRPRRQSIKQMSPAKQVTPKYHARAVVGRRANTLRSVLRKLCGDIKDGEQPSNQSNQRQAQPPPAAETAPGNVVPAPKCPKQPLRRRPSGRLNKPKTRFRGFLEDSCPGPSRVRLLSTREKAPNRFKGSFLNSPFNNTTHGTPDQPSEHEHPGSGGNQGVQGTQGAVLDQTHAQYPQASPGPSPPSTPFVLEELNTIYTPPGNIIDFTDQYFSANSRFTPTLTTTAATDVPTQTQTSYYGTHPPATATASPPHPTTSINRDHNNHEHNNFNNPNHSHNGPNHTNHNHVNHDSIIHDHNNPSNHSLPRPFTNLQYTSMRLAVITETVQLTPCGTSVSVNNHREALLRSPEALVPTTGGGGV